MESGELTTRQAKQQVYGILQEDAPFEDKAEEALEVGEQYLGVENGHLTRIDTQTDHWEAPVSTDPPDGQFPPDLELDLDVTYCRRTIAADEPITLHDAPSQGWDDDPAFETHGLHCYHGTTVYFNQHPYGTICFVSEDPRDNPFQQSETLFAELLTRLLGRELERHHYETELTRRTNLVNVLNRVLRHNLRNDMSVIRAHARRMTEQLEDTSGTTALDKIDELIELSQKARELEDIVIQEYESTQTDLCILIEEVIADVSSEYPDASITLDADEDIQVPVLPIFDRAIEELLENAAKHTGDAPQVTVTVDEVPHAVEIQITDDGPGLSEQEQEVLATGIETPLVHGSGLGLWLVYWIVTSHDGSVEATVTDDGTTMSVRLPRSPSTDEQQDLADIKQARDRYQAAFEQAADAQLIINDDARIIEANPKAAAIYGCDITELRGRSITEFLPADFDFDNAWADFQHSDEEHDTVTIVRPEGDTQQVEYSATTDIVPGQHLLIVRPM